MPKACRTRARWGGSIGDRFTDLCHRLDERIAATAMVPLNKMRFAVAV